MFPEYNRAKTLGWDNSFLSKVAEIKEIYQVDYEINFYDFIDNQDFDHLLISNFFSNQSRGRFLNLGVASGCDQTRALLVKGWAGVYCEPDPLAWRELLDQTLDYKDQVTLINSAVTVQPGLCDFYISETVALSTTQENLATNKSRHSLTNSITLDQLLNKVGQDFDYVQFDLEGIDDDVVASINWNRLPTCKMIGIEGGIPSWKQLWDQGQYVISDITQHNIYFKKLSLIHN